MLYLIKKIIECLVELAFHKVGVLAASCDLVEGVPGVAHQQSRVALLAGQEGVAVTDVSENRLLRSLADIFGKMKATKRKHSSFV